MAGSIEMDLHIAEDRAELYATLADHLVTRINTYVDAEGICSLLLSGGSTPLPLYRQLATEHRDDIPWRQIHLFWGDERFVERSRDESNFKSIMETFGAVDLTAAQIHPIPVAYKNTTESAAAYEHELKLWFEGTVPNFNIALLGIGTDGHVASLFPGTKAVTEDHAWVTPGVSPDPPKDRISVTLPAINGSSEVHFLTSGDSKADVAYKLLNAADASPSFPATMVNPSSGVLKMWLDQAAASKLSL